MSLSFVPLKFSAPPSEAHPPIWLGGSGEFMLKITAKYFDGWSSLASYYIAFIGDYTPTSQLASSLFHM